MRLHFLGVRGSTPMAGPEFVVYGGHTSSILIECDDALFIFDAGSGIINATPLALNRPGKTTHLFFSHTHLDHIMGLPFFGPFWHKDHNIHLYAGHLSLDNGLQNFLTNTFNEPLFPIPFKAFPAHIQCHDFDAGTPFTFKNCTLKTHRLNHPNGAIGYRLCVDGKSICYITDHEHSQTYAYDTLCQFVNETDILIYDSTYDERNFEKYRGWGHSTWQEALKLGSDAKARRIGIFHHDPYNTDDIMRSLEEQITQEHACAFVTKQGMIIDL